MIPFLLMSQMNATSTKNKRIVVKVGSSLVTAQGTGLDLNALQSWSRQIATLNSAGHQIILVSSGAIAEGIKRLGWKKRPTAIHELQAAAAVGQMGLVQAYESCFKQYQLHTAQLLLTHADISNREHYLNARSTLFRLLDLNTIPIINENDTVVTDEIKLGDNDNLGALVANLIDADTLIILTDQPGLYTADPRKDPNATLVSRASATDETLLNMAGGAGSSVGRGGMATKILAARRAARSGTDTIIASGREPDVLLRLLNEESIGTYLHASETILEARKQWLANHLQVSGRLILDSGAVNAIQKQGKSLLPIGVKQINGNFHRGAVVACVTPEGKNIAHGLINYNANECQRIIGKSSGQISSILGYAGDNELIHRDNLVLL